MTMRILPLMLRTLRPRPCPRLLPSPEVLSQRLHGVSGVCLSPQSRFNTPPPPGYPNGRGDSSLAAEPPAIAKEDSTPSVHPQLRGKETRKKKGVRSLMPLGIGGVPGGSISAQHGFTGPPSAPPRAYALCSAEALDFQALLPALSVTGCVVLPYQTDDSLHVRLPDNGPADNPDADAFFFLNGTMVTWGASDAQIAALATAIAAAEINPYAKKEDEWYDYAMDPNEHGGIVVDTILLGSEVPLAQSKLAFSSGLSRSVKLAVLENLLDSYLTANRHIPQILISGRTITLSRNEVLRKLGEILLLRGDVNLHGALLDHPDFLWTNPKLELFFNTISRHLDIIPRISIVNKKLDYANELANTLKSHLSEKHGLKLEWFIIVLIAVEVCFECLHWADRTAKHDAHVAIPDDLPPVTT